MNYLKDIERFVTNKTVFCGMDIHKHHWNLCYFCDGMIVEKTQIPSHFDGLMKHTVQYYNNADQIRFVYEAGFSGFHLYRQLKAAGYECMVTPPNRVPSCKDKVKTDKRDAVKLAQYLSGGLLKSVYVPPLSIESDRQILRLRNDYQKKLTRVKTQIKSFLYLHGLSQPKSIISSWTKRYIVWLKEIEFDDSSLRSVLNHYLAEYHFYRDKIAELTKNIRALSRDEVYAPHFNRLVACRGIGLITAMTFLLELNDLTRFSSAKQFCSYLGLTPSQHSSGDHIRLGHITREGNAHIRRVLVESSWSVIRHEPFLRDKYNRIRARGTNGKKAIVAVAHSLAVRLRRCLIDEVPYQIGMC
jgi:transposase